MDGIPVADNENTDAALAFGNGLALVMADAMRVRLAMPPEVIPGGTDDVQMALVTETGSRFHVEITYAGNEWDSDVAPA